MEEIKNLFEKIEFIIEYSLPDEFKKIYLKTPKINNIELMDLKDIYNEIVNSNDNEEDVEMYEIEPKNSILAKAFDKKRLPFIADYSGNYIGIDYNPGKGGVIGQIINYGTDEYSMKVFAYNFKDFIDGIKMENISEDVYITDYLLRNNIVFLKEKKKDDSIKTITKSESINRMEIKDSIKHEALIATEFKNDYLKIIIDNLSQMNKEIMENPNVKLFKNYWFNFRIINKNDSLSRTMQTEKSFYEKLESYNKDEINGFSFAISNYIEQIVNNEMLLGEEKIFVETNLINNTILIRYTETIGNNDMKRAYEKLKNIFRK